METTTATTYNHSELLASKNVGRILCTLPSLRSWNRHFPKWMEEAVDGITDTELIWVYTQHDGRQPIVIGIYPI